MRAAYCITCRLVTELEGNRCKACGTFSPYAARQKVVEDGSPRAQRIKRNTEVARRGFCGPDVFECPHCRKITRIRPDDSLQRCGWCHKPYRLLRDGMLWTPSDESVQPADV